MTFRIHRLILLLLLALMSNEVAAEPIRIGYLTDLSGPGVSLGEQSRRGASFAERRLREAGQDVRVIFEDHQNDPKQALSGLRELLDIDRVDAVICDLSPPSSAISPVVLSARKLFLYQAPIVSPLAANQHAFRNFLDYHAGCRLIAEQWKQRGIKGVANLKVNLEFGELCKEGSASIYPEQIVIDYNSKDDLRTIAAKFKALRIEAVMQTGYEGDYINFLTHARSLNFTTGFGMPEPLLTQAVMQQAHDAIPFGTITFGFKEIAPTFVTDLKAAGLFGSEVNLPSVGIADHMVRLATEALVGCAKADLGCQTAKVKNAAPDPILGFQGFTEGRVATYDWQIKSWQGGDLAPQR